MPWCEECDRFWTYAALGESTECPSCGRTISKPGEAEQVRAPWHFKLMVAAVVIYLGWRAVQLVEWVVGRF